MAAPPGAISAAMPNWCAQSLTICGPSKDVTACLATGPKIWNDKRREIDEYEKSLEGDTELKAAYHKSLGGCEPRAFNPCGLPERGGRDLDPRETDHVWRLGPRHAGCIWWFELGEPEEFRDTMGDRVEQSVILWLPKFTSRTYHIYLPYQAATSSHMRTCRSLPPDCCHRVWGGHGPPSCRRSSRATWRFANRVEEQDALALARGETIVMTRVRHLMRVI